MKRSLIILVNIGFVLLVMAFVLLYTRGEARSMVQAQTEAFESMTVAMEKVTMNYLRGEQRLCDSRANAINNSSMDMDSAVTFLKAAQTMPEITAHLDLHRRRLPGWILHPGQGQRGGRQPGVLRQPEAA